MASLVDRGLLESYDTKVASVWPRFAAHGKGDVTVTSLLRHEAGLAGLAGSFNVEDTTAEGIRAGKMSKYLEGQEIDFPPVEFGSDRE